MPLPLSVDGNMQGGEIRPGPKAGSLSRCCKAVFVQYRPKTRYRNGRSWLEADMDNDYGLGLLFYAERTLRRRMSAYRRQAEVFMGRAGGAVLTQLRNCYSEDHLFLIWRTLGPQDNFGGTGRLRHSEDKQDSLRNIVWRNHSLLIQPI